MGHIPKKSARADVYDAICRYALDGERPELEKLSGQAVVAIMLIMPVLESGRKKAAAAYKSNEGQLQTDCKATAKLLQTHCKKENKKEDKNEIEKECEKDSCAGAPVGVGVNTGDFDLFWAEYPKKVGKQDARAAFEKITVPVARLVDALRQHKQSGQWARENGRFIPNPATWLKQQRWEDELPYAGGVPKGASGRLGKAELESIQRMLKED